MDLEKQEECRPTVSDSEFPNDEFSKIGILRTECLPVDTTSTLKRKEAKEALANLANAIYYNPAGFPRPGPESSSPLGKGCILVMVT
jgi:hypothetical protein